MARKKAKQQQPTFNRIFDEAAKTKQTRTGESGTKKEPARVKPGIDSNRSSTSQSEQNTKN